MKFEHVLQIYWTKGFFFGGNLFYYNQTLSSLQDNTPGLKHKVNHLLIQRFELTLLAPQKTVLIPTYEAQSLKIVSKPLNVFLSQVHTVNNTYTDLLRLRIMQSYLIKSYRGRCHAIGKPVKGQRTWSNGWNSYRTNNTLRYFLIEIRRKAQKSITSEKINYKVVKKKYPTKKKQTSDSKAKATAKWF